ncbi:GerMN domain-containing protein [Jeotgalibaca sp. MA1X17-3]|uniref:GerMN domain-containing protein n=1 Tax=Jeotgalibaca sp. MA1X17-3 TaxID=2908211 RepID=UPI001F3B1B90|nr:GerMN domain-containing protein [Jeotgalibaca sp. MA1X17-3]UJF15815.1 GerMN domain-containing protein [Jeotgalibaca sp. MA1X17-3]
MKKYKIVSGLALVTLLATGCVNTDPNSDSSSSTGSLESSEESSLVSSESSIESSSIDENEMTIENYFPFDESVQYSYLGEGNEFAPFDRYPQYIEGNRIQYTEKNPGTTHTFVLEYKDGKLTELFSRPETYFRENMLEKTSDGAGEILLKEPLEVGNNWENPSGVTSEITSVDFSVETPLGVFSAIEVTKTQEDSVTKSYYTKNMGLIKQEFTANDDSYVVSSTLETRSEEAPEVVVITAYYPDANAMGLETSDVNVSFYTNDVTRKTMADLLKQVPGVEYGKLISDNTEINSLYLNEDGRVYVDFSKELVEDMNAGSSGESLILQGIVNTIGNYYSVEEVVLTVENQPYESGHYSMMEDESFRVEME